MDRFGLYGMVRGPPVYSSLLGLARVCSPCLAAPFPSGALVSHVRGLFEAVPCGRRGAARHSKPALGGVVGVVWERCFVLTPGGLCPLVPTALWAACTAAEHL